jgi:hypothetical protein
MAHDTPRPVRSLVLALLAYAPAAGAAGFIGAETCKACHPYAYDAWRGSAHARAQLAVPEKQRQEARCTACHAPDAAAGVEGVSCETCHGAGQLYAARYVMRDPELARAVGLQDAGEKRCLGCHTDTTPSLRSFDYRKKLPLIEHWKGEKAWTRKRGGGVH